MKRNNPRENLIEPRQDLRRPSQQNLELEEAQELLRPKSKFKKITGDRTSRSYKI